MRTKEKLRQILSKNKTRARELRAESGELSVANCFKSNVAKDNRGDHIPDQ